MKLLTIAVPCYNSEAYMRRCIESLLPGGDEVEILIVDDGSTKDRTPEIADEYARDHPDICRVIHQANGGHGDAVNTALRHASGLFFKVVDSDDHVDNDAYMEVLRILRGSAESGRPMDMMITNYIYDKKGARHKKIISYRVPFPRGRIFTWDDVRCFTLGQYILMHSLVYRTELLRACGMKLPKHTFYVDNIFAFQPLPYVKTMYYLDMTFYQYYIGREDQSVNEHVMIARIDQQIRVTKLMLRYYQNSEIENVKLRRYMVRYLEIMMAISSILAIRSGTPENMSKKKKLWRYVQQLDPTLYRRLRWGLLGIFMNLPGRGGRAISVAGYKISQKLFGFN